LDACVNPGSRLQSIHREVTGLKAYERLSLRRILEAIGEAAGGGNPLFEVSSITSIFMFTPRSEQDWFQRGIIEGHEATDTLLDFSVSGMFGSYSVTIKCGGRA
jgi:hypothetical protein